MSIGRLRGGGICSFFFFFQAEDGIRDDLVTGVQTCALPIYSSTKRFSDMKCTRNLPPDEMVLKGNQILNRTKNFPGVPPLLNFQNFEVAFLGSGLSRDAETLHADSRGQWH